MDWLNYHHLLYFWVVASEGSITGACERLHLAQPTISSQLKKLEQSIGSKLFERSGRSLVLTDTGRLVFEYAEQIFSLGRELSEVLAGRQGRARRLAVGVPDVFPKLVTFRILEPWRFLEGVGWSASIPPETFSFCRCRIRCGADEEEGLVYYPHPETKPGHFQSPSIVEVLAPWLPGVGPGRTVVLMVRRDEVAIRPEGSAT